MAHGRRPAWSAFAPTHTGAFPLQYTSSERRRTETTFAGPRAAARGPVLFSREPDGAAMPKMKTHKASKKRFRVTASGKLKRSQAGKKHLNSPKTGKRKRHLREEIVSGNKFARKYIKAMGGDA